MAAKATNTVKLVESFSEEFLNDLVQDLNNYMQANKDANPQVVIAQYTTNSFYFAIVCKDVEINK